MCYLFSVSKSQSTPLKPSTVHIRDSGQAKTWAKLQFTIMYFIVNNYDNITLTILITIAISTE